MPVVPCVKCEYTKRYNDIPRCVLTETELQQVAVSAEAQAPVVSSRGAQPVAPVVSSNVEASSAGPRTPRSPEMSSYRERTGSVSSVRYALMYTQHNTHEKALAAKNLSQTTGRESELGCGARERDNGESEEGSGGELHLV